LKIVFSVYFIFYESGKQYLGFFEIGIVIGVNIFAFGLNGILFYEEIMIRY
jgi:hypothetical protein